MYDNSTLLSPAWEQAAAFHYEMCLSKAKMTNGQLAANVLNFASDKPKLQTGPVQLALIEYLFETNRVTWPVGLLQPTRKFSANDLPERSTSS